VIAGEKYFQDPYYLTTQMNATVAQLRTLLRDRPSQLQQLDSLKGLIAEKLAFHRRMIELRRNSGEGPAVELFLTGRGHVLRDEIRDRVDTMGDAEEGVLRDRTAAAASRIGSVHFDLGSGFRTQLRHPASRVPESRPGDRSAPAVGAEGAAIEPACTPCSTAPSQSIVRVRERDALFRAVCRIAVEDGLFRMAWVGTVNPQTGVVEPAAFAGFEDGYLERIHIVAADVPEGQGPTGQALRGRRHFVCADIAADPRLLPWRDEALARGYRSSAAFSASVWGLGGGGIYPLRRGAQDLR